MARETSLRSNRQAQATMKLPQADARRELDMLACTYGSSYRNNEYRTVLYADVNGEQ